MATTGEIKSLYTDINETKAIFPRTKVRAITDDNGVGLNAILADAAYVGPRTGYTATAPVDAETLAGRPAADYATQAFVTNKIAEAQLSGDGAGNIDLTGFASKDDVDAKILAATGIGKDVVTATGFSTYTLSRSDTGKQLHFMDGDTVSATTIVVPTDANLTIPIGSEIEIVRWNSSLAITIQTETGTTSPLSFRTSRTNSTASLGINGKYGTIKLKRLNATKWFISGDVADDHYPIGSIYLSVAATSPAELFGGTWTQLKDRFLLGAGSSYTNGDTGGSKTVTLTESQIPSHTHGLKYVTTTVGTTGGIKDVTVLSTAGSSSTSYIEKTGSSSSHTNMPPYLVVYMWKRTA